MTKPLPYVLVLRTCKSDMTSYNNFKWPVKGKVRCPDWNPEPKCGNGLHGFLWGVGDASLANWYDGAKWLVVKVFKKDIIELGGKVKFSKGEVLFTGNRKDATDFLCQHPEAKYKPVIGCYKIGGDYSTLTGGDCSTLTGGDYSTLTGGYNSTLTGENESTLTGGDLSILTGGYNSTLTGGDLSILTGGNYSTLTWKIWDGKYYRIHIFYVGENSIKQNTPYVFENGEIKEKT